uniref:SMI1/KNR4 family protein n=1 Tax=Arsukibacterium sp. TaxID=1977258 RepID=UPI002FD9AD5D
SSVIILLLHQIVLVFAGAWSLSKLPMLVVPVAFFVWLHCTKRLTIRLSKDALCLALGRKECKLNRWREIFEQSAMNVPDKEELEIRYQFGQPSTESELATLEHQLGGPIPTELRSMLKEFNGIEIKEKDWGESWRPLYLSIAQILLEVVDYIETSGNPMPASDELANVVFFAHQNGFAELYAVCMRDFSEFRSGQILVLDHETGELQLAEESLSAFVSNPDYCTL